MDALVIGGTRFVGRHIAQAATDAGHELTLFNLGLTSPGLFPAASMSAGTARPAVWPRLRAGASTRPWTRRPTSRPTSRRQRMSRPNTTC